MKKLLLLLFILPCLSMIQSLQAQNAKPSDEHNRTIDSLLILLSKDKLSEKISVVGRLDTTKIIHLYSLCREYTNIGENDSALFYGNAAIRYADLIIASGSITKQIRNSILKGEANAYNNIGVVYKNQGDYDKALGHYFTALKINEEIENKKDIAKNIANIGIVYRNQSNYPKALEYYFNALKINKEIGYKNGIAENLSSIGVVYDYQGDYPKALEFYFKALKINEEVENEEGIARNLGNIGIVYRWQGDYPKALEYYFKALKMDERLKDKNGIASNLGSIGNVYSEQRDFPKALESYFKSLKIFEEIGQKKGIATVLGNIGNVYKEQINYPKALKFYFDALKMTEDIGDKNGIALWLGNIGSLYAMQKKYNDAEDYLLKSVKLSDEIGDLNGAMDVNKRLSDLYITKGDYKKAYEHQQKFSMAKDSLFNIEKFDDITRKEMNYEFEKKEAAATAEQEKQTAVATAESKKQKIIIWSVVSGLFLVVVFAIFIFRSLRSSQKQKRIIEEQKQVVENQKHLVEEKHKEITDSINYAERIQRSFLATTELLDENLKDYFVFFQPKDVVSGDFYWASKLSNGNFALATADSTGHGVPGAIMSILNISCLEKAVEQEKLTEPADILNHTRTKIIERLKKDGSTEGGKDGMDCSLICFDFAKNTLTYAAANNPVWIVRPNSAFEGNVRDIELLELPSDKMPVGKHDKDIIPFRQHTTHLQKGDVVYALTDGFPDQFGGPKGKKFMYKQLKELLIGMAHLSMSEQKDILNTSLNNWKGNLEQVDDICVIGIKI